MKAFRDLDRGERGFDSIRPRIPTGTRANRHGPYRAVFGIEYRLNDVQFGLSKGIDLRVTEAHNVAFFVETRVENFNLPLARVI